MLRHVKEFGSAALDNVFLIQYKDVAMTLQTSFGAAVAAWFDKTQVERDLLALYERKTSSTMTFYRSHWLHRLLWLLSEVTVEKPFPVEFATDEEEMFEEREVSEQDVPAVKAPSLRLPWLQKRVLEDSKSAEIVSERLG